MEQAKKMDNIFVFKRYLEAGSMKSHEKLKPKFLHDELNDFAELHS